jgi:sugar lactone lactonase YvrE
LNPLLSLGAYADPSPFEEFHTILQDLNHWEHHRASSLRDRSYVWDLKKTEERVSHFTLLRDEYLNSHGGEDFNRSYRQSELFRKDLSTFSQCRVLPDRNSEPLYSANRLEEVFATDFPRDHIALSDSGQIFLDFFDHDNKSERKITVYDPRKGKTVPFPSLEEQEKFHHIHSLRVDSKDRLWLLDGGGKWFFVKPKLFAYDIKTGDLMVEYHFPEEVAGNGSFLNDLTLDEKRQRIYITDTNPYPYFGKPALIVFDMEKNASRRVLEKHVSVSTASYDTYLDYNGGKKWKVFWLVAPKVGADALIYDPQSDLVYFAPNNSGQLYSLDASILADFSMSDEEIRMAVNKVADITMTDGMALDEEGHLYLTDMEHSALLRLNPETGELTTLIRDSDVMPFVSALEFGPDKKLYFSVFPMHNLMFKSEKTIREMGEKYPVYRFDPFAK